MDHFTDQPVRVSIEFLIENTPPILYIWSHVSANWLVDQLRHHGVNASAVKIEVNGNTRPPQ